MDLINAQKIGHVKIHSFPFVLIKLDLCWEINSQSRYGAGDSLLPKLSVLVWHSSETFLKQAVRAVQCCHILHFSQGKWVVWKTLDAWKHLWILPFTAWPNCYFPKSGRLQLANPTLLYIALLWLVFTSPLQEKKQYITDILGISHRVLLVY